MEVAARIAEGISRTARWRILPNYAFRRPPLNDYYQRLGIPVIAIRDAVLTCRRLMCPADDSWIAGWIFPEIWGREVGEYIPFGFPEYEDFFVAFRQTGLIKEATLTTGQRIFKATTLFRQILEDHLLELDELEQLQSFQGLTLKE